MGKGVKSCDIELENFLKSVLKGSEYYNENIIMLFSNTRSTDLYRSGYGNYIEIPNILERYKKFYNRLDNYLSAFGEKTKYIIELRYGLKSEEFKSFVEIGKMFNLSSSRIREIVESTLRELRGRTVYYGVEGVPLEWEELPLYKKAYLGDIVGSLVSSELSRKYNIRSVVQFREFLVEIYGNTITEDMLVSLFTTLSCVGYLRAEKSLKHLKESGCWDFITKGI